MQFSVSYTVELFQKFRKANSNVVDLFLLFCVACLPFVGVDPSGLGVIILASGSEVCGFHPSRGRWIFQNVKILSMTSFRREVKPGVCVIDLRHVKEPQAEIRASEQNLSAFSRSMSKVTLMT